MNAIYGSRPAGKEQLADCMAYAMGADKNYGGTYTRDCSCYRGHCRPENPGRTEALTAGPAAPSPGRRPLAVASSTCRSSVLAFRLLTCENTAPDTAARGCFADTMAAQSPVETGVR
ncbi:hypothetical protein ACVWYS_003109 [Arthrobacter sp. TE12231]